MYEVEVKVRADHDDVRDRLEELDAERVDTVEQVDTYYDAPHRSFAETDEALRIRAETRADDRSIDGDGRTDAADRSIDSADLSNGAGDDRSVHELTYKGPKVDTESKTREEHETVVGDPAATDDALTALGFEPAATVEKRRERYRLGGYTVTLDVVDGLGEFVEVERAVEATDVDAARDGALDLLSDLGVDPDEQVRTSYLGLLLGEDEPL